MKQYLTIGTIVTIFTASIIISVFNYTPQLQVQRGCCSHHGGVCGCASGRARCCDGSLSPSCGCRADENFTFKKCLLNS